VTYVNLGSWAHDDLDGPVSEAARTHLVIRVVDGKPEAKLLEWDPEARACRARRDSGPGYTKPLKFSLFLPTERAPASCLCRCDTSGEKVSSAAIFRPFFRAQHVRHRGFQPRRQCGRRARPRSDPA
jgi:hypothetical protein